MFGKLFDLAKDVATLPVSVAVDLANVVALGAIDDTRDESFTETNLKNIGESTDKLLDSQD